MSQVPDRHWIFRGQPNKLELTSTLERSLENWRIKLADGPAIESELIREFRRRVADPIYQRIQNDTLYCMSLMRHYGAPVRLLDCTYSPFVAAKFALENGVKNGAVVYCFNGDWCKANVPSELKSVVEERHRDINRTDITFEQMYLSPKSRRKFIQYENPLHLNERLTIQQGIFLCPGDVGVSFLENVKAMSGWDDKNNIIEFHLELEGGDLAEFARKLKLMNISSAALFPGLEGFARSLGEHVLHFREISSRQRT